MTGPQFELVNVSKTYGTSVALSDVSFALVAGRQTAILGPSGGGKSTVLRLVAGLEAPSAGSVLLNGRQLSLPGRILIPPHQRGLTMVFQDLALWPNLSVRENVRLGLSGNSLSLRQAHERVMESLKQCGIESLADRLPGQLSGGQQQRVALARAVAVRPAFLFLDEPFSGIDTLNKSRLLRMIGELARTTDLTVVLVSHDPLEARELCDYAVVLEAGRLAEMGCIAELFQSPKSEFLRAFRELRGGDETTPRPKEAAGNTDPA
jgi:ABC-type Fe3+/spermidine/putrescine transport system ATPase subunit